MHKSDSPDPAGTAASYRVHNVEISLHMSHFLLDYLQAIYDAFDGDLALAIVLGEIAHHNTSSQFSSRVGLDPTLAGQSEPEIRAKCSFQSCNAHSLAQATGLPRETIRRKIARLKELGWIEQTTRREVQITPKVGDIFLPGFNVKLMTNLLQTAERVRGLLQSKSQSPSR